MGMGHGSKPIAYLVGMISIFQSLFGVKWRSKVAATFKPLVVRGFVLGSLRGSRSRVFGLIHFFQQTLLLQIDLMD